jgi:DNA-binding CsgD family transcriptional regulator/WD40 repeat protein
VNVTAPHISPLDRLREDFRWTPRQRQVLDLLAARHTNGEIAAALGISLDGAKWHVSEVMTKLGTNSRDEAAEYWRAYNRLPLRFSRLVRGMVAGLALRKLAIGAGVAGLVAVAALGALSLANLGGDDSEPAPTDDTPSPTVGTSTPQATTTATQIAPPSGTPEPLVPIDVPNGGTVPTDNGLLYVDLDTGEMTFWPMPGTSYYAPSVSRDGRWVVWTAGDGVHDSGVHLLDTETANDRLVEAGTSAILDARVSPDGRFVIARGDSRLFLIESESMATVADAPLPGASPNGWAEFARDGSVAVAFGPSPATPSVVVLHPDGSSFAADAATWPLRWSPDSEYLAVTAERSTQVLNRTGDRVWDIPFLGSDENANPRWSPDGRYFSVTSWPALGGVRIFDFLSRAEVMRTEGTFACFDYWASADSVDFESDTSLARVPSGETVEATADVPYAFVQAGEPAVTSLRLRSGNTVSFRTSGTWSVPYDSEGIHSSTNEGRALFLVGSSGGKDLCITFSEKSPAVLLPPF